MIYLIVGENPYLRNEKITEIVGGHDVERFDGRTIDENDLADIFMGQTLFAEERIIVIDQLSENKLAWEKLDYWVDKLNDSTTLILIEDKVDKRTKTYKKLLSDAELVEVDHFYDPKDRARVLDWLVKQAKNHPLNIDTKLIDNMVSRATYVDEKSGKNIIDMRNLMTVIDQLSHVDKIDEHTIETVMGDNRLENVFGLLGAAFDGRVDDIAKMINKLMHHQDAYRVLALLSSQLSNLAAIKHKGSRSTSDVARDVGANPYVLRQLEGSAQKISKDDLAYAVGCLIDADANAKNGQNPWTMIELSLKKIALRSSN
jgi:DNA polymerase-3 subunit delta